MPFGETLQRIRRAKGITQRDVADAIGMDYGYYSRLENDRLEHNPKRETIEKIVGALKCDDAETDELLSQAGRIASEMEDVARMTTERPDLKELFRTAAKLSPERVRELTEQAKRVQARRKTKPK